MFPKLFAESGLSLDRLKALVAVGAAGSIVRASAGDPVRQSQYSRQIKELEDFFHTRLIERHGKGVRLTPGGKELARISRFFLLGLSNFQRGGLKEEQIYRIGAASTFISQILLPVLADARSIKSGIRYSVETAGDDDIERRLHDLTLDFGVVMRSSLSRPLQSKELGTWNLKLWVPKELFKNARHALEAFQDGRMPWIFPFGEFPLQESSKFIAGEPHLSCNSFIESRTASQEHGLAMILPDFLPPPESTGAFVSVRIPSIQNLTFQYRLAWNPRLLRLNQHADRRREYLLISLASKMHAISPQRIKSRSSKSTDR
jgi:DNA-binding transcriptional LysR family regulator